MPYKKYNSSNNAFAAFNLPIADTDVTCVLKWKFWRFPTSNFIMKATHVENGVVTGRENIYVTTRTGATCTGLIRAYEPVPTDDDATTNIQQALNFSADDIVEVVVSSEFMKDMQEEIDAKLAKSGWLRTWFWVNKTVYVEPATGNEVLKNSTSSVTIQDTEEIIWRNPSTWNENRVPFSNIKNQLSSAWKATQAVTFAETISAWTPTAVAIRTSFTRNDFVPLLTTNSGNPDFLVSQSATYSDPTYNGVNVFDKNATTSWYTNSAWSHWIKINFSQRRCITSLKIQAKWSVFEPSGWKLQGSNDDSTYTDVYTSASSTTTSLVTHTFTNTNFYKYYRLLFPSHPAQGEIVTVEFSESFVAPYTLSAYKTQAYELSEVCQFAGFVQWPKSIWDTETISCGNWTPVSWFSGLTILSKYYLSNTPWIISTTPWAVSRLVGYTLYDPTVLIIDNWNLLPWTNITR